MLLSRRYTRKLQGRSKRKQPVQLEKDYPSGNYVKRRSCELNAEEKVSVVHKVLVELHSYDHTARLHRISKALVGSLVSKAKKNRKFLSELMAIQKSKEDVNT
jgi:hypothetical protein